jgi:hypothetical protein
MYEIVGVQSLGQEEIAGVQSLGQEILVVGWEWRAVSWE